MRVSELDQWELDNERPRVIKDDSLKLQKTKAIVKDDESKVEFSAAHDGGFFVCFTTSLPVTTEEVVECNLGHRHKRVIEREYNYERVHVTRKNKKLLLDWLRDL